MPTVTYDTDQGPKKIRFDATPSPQDIEEVAHKQGWKPKATPSSGRPKPEGFVEGLYKDAKLGFKSSAADLEHTAGNIASMVGAADTAASLQKEAQATQPTQEEMLGREGFTSSIAQAAGSLPLSLVKYAPALAAKRIPFATPIIAGLTDAAGASDKGAGEALKQGVGTALAFEGQELAGKLKTRLGRTLGGAAAMAAPTAYATGGNVQKTGAAAAIGALTGGLTKDPAKPASPEILKAAKEAATSAKDDLQKVLSPMSRAETGALAARITRPHLAELARKGDIAEYALRKSRDYFDSQPIDKSLGNISREGFNFVDASENGQVKQKIADPVMQGQAQAIKDALDDRYNRLEKRGHLQTYVENYFPRNWTKPEIATQAYGMIGKRPLEGTKGFTRQRKFASLKEGLDFAKANPQYGLELVDSNPIDAVLRKIHDMDRLLAAGDIMEDMKKNKLLQYVSTSDRAPAGFAKIDDKVSTVQFRHPKSGMTTIAGHWYAPEPAARVINNYLSPGLRSKPWFRAINIVANTMNQFQLGWSAFHLGFTTYEAAQANFALGVEKVAHGIATKDPKFIAGGVKDWLLAAPRAVEPITANLSPGGRDRSVTNQVWEEWMKPGSHPQVAPMVEMMKQAGARVQMNPFYRTQYWRQMKQAWVNGNHWQAGWKAFPALTEHTMRPIMEYVVPRQKIAAFMKMAEFEMERLPQGTPQPVIQKRLQTAWDSVENRFGQMTYDNKFWDNMTKDLMQIGIRSVGWNAGTLGEGFGAIYDFATMKKRMAAGDPALTHKMAYLVTLPTTTALIGGITTYLNTGERPKDWQDLFFPRTGGVDQYGRPERFSLPSYMTTTLKWMQHIRQEGVGKGLLNIGKGMLHPIVGLTADMLTNEDWKQNKIRDDSGNSNWVQQLMQEATYAGKQALTPISAARIGEDYAASQRGAPPPYSPGMSVGALFGAQSATQAMTKTDAEAYLDRFADADHKTSDGDLMGEKRFQRVRDLERIIRLHKDEPDQGEKQIQEYIDKAVASGEMEPKDIKQAYDRVQTPPLVRRFRHATFERALEAYKLALSDDSIPVEQMDQVQAEMQKKVASELVKLSNRPAGDTATTRIMAKLRELGLLDSSSSKPPSVQ